MSTVRKTARWRNWKIVWEGGIYADIAPLGGYPVDTLNLPNDSYTTGELRNLLREWLIENKDILGEYLASAGQ